MLQLISKVLAEADVEPLKVTMDTSNGSTDLAGLIDKVIPWVSLAAGVIAFAYLIYSGFIYLTAGGNAESAKKGQTGILNAIIGLIIIALAYTISTAVIGTLNNAS